MPLLPLYNDKHTTPSNSSKLFKHIRTRLLSARLDVSSPSSLLPYAASCLCLTLFSLVLYLYLTGSAGSSSLPPPPSPILTPSPTPSPSPSSTPSPSTTPSPTTTTTSTPSSSLSSLTSDKERAAAVRAAFVHAYRGYTEHAFGHDEIRPTTNATNDSWGGFGVTLVDGLDTLILMGLEEFLPAAREHVAGIDFAVDYTASFFETTIRYLGGLLSAHSLTHDAVYLEKAIQLGDALLPAFNSPTGIPYHEVNLKTGKAGNPSWNAEYSILSEIGSVQLEFKALSHFSGDPKYAAAADRVMDTLIRHAHETEKGLYPVYISPTSGAFRDSHVTMGALADSFYEYLLKQWLLTGKEEPKFKKMYDDAVDGMTALLLTKSHPSGLLFVGEATNGQKSNVFDHLMCFVPGMLALGSIHEPDASRASVHLGLAKELANTCYALYSRSPSGLAPDVVTFNTRPTPGVTDDFRIKSSNYLLRPETLESLYILHSITKDPMYKEQAWSIFLAIQDHCKTESAYSGVVDVGSKSPRKNNSMQSFFLAETLKYLYLMFANPPDQDLVPLDQFVFNTEAHPLPIFALRHN